METKIATVNISQEEYNKLVREALKYRSIKNSYTEYQKALLDIENEDISESAQQQAKKEAMEELHWQLNFEIKYHGGVK